MIIGIVGYFTVPSVANYIVHAGGGNALNQKVTSIFSSGASASTSMIKQGGSSMVKDVYGNTAGAIRSGMAAAGSASDYFKDKLKGGDA